MRCSLFFVCAAVAFAQDRVCELRTIAGPVTTDAGDGGAAIEAQFLQPTAMAVARDGSIYVADTGNDKIRRISADGTVETVAGTGVRGSSGDGAPAKDARLAAPTGLALDLDGSLYVTESHRLRRIGTDGIIVTVAGTGQPGFTAPDGPALEMQLNYPDSVAVLSDGRILIADSSNHRILELRDGQLRTVAGLRDPLRERPTYSGDDGEAVKAGVVSPVRIVAGRNGDYYFYDSRRVRSVDSRGFIRTVVGGPSPDSLAPPDGALASRIDLNSLVSFAVDLEGNLIFIPGVSPITANFPWILNSDGTIRALNRALRLGARGLIVSPIHGTLFTDPDGIVRFEGGTPLVRFAGVSSIGFAGDGGLAVNALFTNPTSVATIGELIYVVDAANRRIRRIDADGRISTFAGTGILASDGNPPEARLLNILNARDIAIDLDGNVWLADSGKARIQRIAPDGTVSTILGPGLVVGGPGRIGDGITGTSNPFALGVSSDGDVYFSDSAGRGGYYRRIALKEQLVHVIALSSASPIMYLRSGSGGIVAFSPTPNTGVGGVFFELDPDKPPRPLSPPLTFRGNAATFTPDGNLYYTNDFGLYRRTPDGKVILLWNSGGDIGPKPAFSPFTGLAADASGNLIFAQQQRVRILANPQSCQGSFEPNP